MIEVLLSAVVAVTPLSKTIEPPVKEEAAVVVGAAPRTVIRTLNDEFPVEIAKSMEVFFDNNSDLIGSVKPKPVKFADAIKRAQQLIGKPKVAEELKRKAAALPAAKHPDGLKAATIALLLKKRNREALALLVLMHERNPQDPNPLFQLAGLLAALGEVNEALAILDEIQVRGKLPQVQWGMEATHVVEYLRAYCLLRLGQTAKAKPMLKRIVEKEPQLTEAAHALALIEAADGEDPRKTFIKGLWRKRAKPFVTEPGDNVGGDPEREGEAIAMPIDELIDFNRGTPGELPHITYAVSIDRAAAAHERFTRLIDQNQNEFYSLQQRLVETKQKLESFKHTDLDVTETREYVLYKAMTFNYGHNPRLYQLWKTIEDQRPAFNAQHSKIYDQANRQIGALPPAPFNVQCGKVKPIVERAMTAYRSHGMATDQRLRNYYREWHLTATSIAAAIGDKGWHEVLRLEVEIEKRRVYIELMQLVQRMNYLATHAKAICQLAEQQEAQAKLEPSQLRPCTDEQAKNSVGYEVGAFGIPGAKRVVGLEVNCKGMTAELNFQIVGDLLSVSTELGIDVTGEITVFVGPKTAAAIPNVGTGHSFKDGMYVKFGKDGVHDVGAKVEIKATQSAMGVTAARTVESMEFSLMPAPSAPPNPGALPAFSGAIP